MTLNTFVILMSFSLSRYSYMIFSQCYRIAESVGKKLIQQHGEVRTAGSSPFHSITVTDFITTRHNARESVLLYSYLPNLQMKLQVPDLQY